LPVSHIVFSLHFEKDWDRVLDTIINYAARDVEPGMRKPCMINVMAYHNKMSEVRVAVKRLENYNIPYTIRRIRWTNDDHNLFDDMRYDQTDLDWILEKDATAEPNTIIDNEIKMHANDIIKKHMNQYKGWSCNAGLESLMINWDGEVHRATCRVGGSLGNIYNGTFNVPSDSVICTRDYCTCAADIPLSKSVV
jgi:hypothetical protein